MVLSKADLEAFLQPRHTWCVTISMPTHRAGPEIQQDPIQLKNLLRAAEHRLVAGSLRGPEAQQLLRPAVDLVDDRLFWEHQSDGLAVLLAPGWFRVFHLPYAPAERSRVSRRVSITPFLPLVTEEMRYYVLALSQDHQRLLLCTPFSVAEVPLPGIPGDLAAALGTDDPESQLQFHTGTSAPVTGGRRRPAVFHGHGVGIDDVKDRLIRYLRGVDVGVSAVLKDERAPLVLASVNSVLPVYREVTAYPYLASEGVPGNPEGLRNEELQQRAWEIVKPGVDATKARAKARLHELAAKDRAIRDVNTVVLAAGEGRVDELFVAPRSEQWGIIDAERRTVVPCAPDEPRGDELVDVSIAETLAHRGTVHVFDELDSTPASPLAATMRY